MKRNARSERGTIEAEAAAIAQGPTKKNWTKHDLMRLQSRSQKQQNAIDHYEAGNHVGMFGSAGTGKTLVASYLAANSLVSDPDIQRIIFIRSAVQTRDIGFLPGTIEEKQAPYEEVYAAALGVLFGRPTTWKHMKEAGKVEFRLSSFLRGLTFEKAVIVVDEAQNMTFDELNTIVTRLGAGSRLIVLGDTKQIDLVGMGRDTSGLECLCSIMEGVDEFKSVYFDSKDIVRSGFVRKWIMAVEDIATKGLRAVA